jgi:GTPase SAR1 family protein
MKTFTQGDQLMYASYFAPRGRNRMYGLGQRLAECYLSPLDKLIGVIGDAGAGKSSLIRGMFPGLELTNDDEGVNIRPLPLLKNIDKGFFSSHTYHLDMRFEMAFTQIHELASAVEKALSNGKRVIVEHFDLLFPHIGRNADVLIGVGGEVILSRPTVFGPLPKEISDIVVKTLKYRKMAHTAEDLTSRILVNEYGIKAIAHRDVHHGYVLEFSEKPTVQLPEVARKVQRTIDEGYSVCYIDECHIRIGDDTWSCTGPRTHVKNTADIEHFRLLPECKYDPQTKTYLLIGLVGSRKDDLDGLAALIEAATL